MSNSINARLSAANLWIIDRKGPAGSLISVTISMVLLGCPLLGVAAIRANDIAFVSARLVDYHDQQELPLPRSAGLEELIGRQQADQAASIVSPQEPRDRPHRPLLRIEFRSSMDLRAIANRDATVFLHSYFCSHQNNFAVLSAPTVYADGEPIRALETRSENSTGGNPGQEFTYYFYLNVLRKENRNSRPPQMGFDLRVTAENICFYITGSGASGLIYTSSAGLIPQVAIVAALHAPSTQGLRDAPESLVIENATLRLQAFPSEDRMPRAVSQDPDTGLTNPDGKPLHISFRLISETGTSLPSALYAETVWILQRDQVWKTEAIEETVGASNRSSRDFLVHGGPTWRSMAPIDVIIKLVDGKGAAFLLAVRHQRIQGLS